MQVLGAGIIPRKGLCDSTIRQSCAIILPGNITSPGHARFVPLAFARTVAMARYMYNEQITSKERVVERGEVFTAAREVNAMLDLVKHESERIESRFLEPACGTGNFLAEILSRKLGQVSTLYGRSRIEYERYAILAVSSIYGIDILQDNVEACRERLWNLFEQMYVQALGKPCPDKYRAAVRYILQRNIIWGDALSLKSAENDREPIVFSQWALVGRGLVKRRDYAFHELLASDASVTPTLFDKAERSYLSDQGKPVFIPVPVKEYPPVHYLRVADVDAP